MSNVIAASGPPFGLTYLLVRIGILGGPGLSPDTPLDGAVQLLGTELARRGWDMVLGIPGQVALDTNGAGVDAWRWSREALNQAPELLICGPWTGRPHD